jgi:fermentation-respiration switch protein FrsA (DUF1100 family)
VGGGLLTRYRFDNRTKVPTLHIPIVMVHAVDDQVVPLSAARAMFREIRAPKRLVAADGGHHDAGFTTSTNLGAELARFWPLNQAQKNPAPPFGDAGPSYFRLRTSYF